MSKPSATNAKAERPLTIGFVLDDSLDTPDGVQQYVLTLGEWLRHRGHQVHYLVGATKRQDIANVHPLSRNVRVAFNGNRMTAPLPASSRAIKKILTRYQFDVLHVQMPYSPFMAAKVIRAADQHTAIVGTFHVAPHSRMAARANRLLAGWLQSTLRRFDAVVAVSPTAQAFGRRYGGLKNSIIIPNMLPLQPFLNARPLATYRHKRTIMFFGRLVPRKGCSWLLQALAELQAEDRLPADSLALICGDGPLRPQLEKYVHDHGLDDIVQFLGFIPEADKPDYVATADIAVFPSTGGESFGIVLLEAMAAARGAVLAGNNPGYADVMGEHTEALFIPQDTAALAARLDQLLHRPAERQAAHSWQQQYVRRFDIEVVGRQLLDVYAKSIATRGQLGNNKD